MDTYYAIVIVLVQVLLAIYTAAITAIVAYGALAAAVVGLLGTIVYSVSARRQAEFLVLGLAAGFHRVQLL